MNNLIFATHLGFSSWDSLLEYSQLVSTEGTKKWYVTNTPTWYKWVLWNTHYDLYFNHTTKNEALETLKFMYEKSHITSFQWEDLSDYNHLEGCMRGTRESPITTDPMSLTWLPET